MYHIVEAEVQLIKIKNEVGVMIVMKKKEVKRVVSVIMMMMILSIMINSLRIKGQYSSLNSS